ncbi:transposase, partial [Klebsiella quasipneumoniae]|uniref:transposase n=3 Tax=Klebsiella pneumoniae complex TaxID=3390273 RepID=UPI0039837B0D
MSGKRYPEEFKTEAVKQVVDRGYSVASVATRLDITTHSLYAWIKKYGPDSSTNKEQSDAQAEIRKRAARTVLTGMCYSVGSATRQGSSS